MTKLPARLCHAWQQQQLLHSKTPTLAFLTFLLAVLLSSCEAVSSVSSLDEQGILNPEGHGASAIADLWWFMFAVSGVIYLIVLALLLGALFRRRNSYELDRTAPPPRGSRTFILVSGVAIPAVVLIVLFALTLQTMNALANPNASEDSVTVEVVGKQWWWEVRYPDYGFVTANEIHIPANESVRILLTSADVIHSFWVPELQGKTDLMPGMTSTLWIEAQRPGEYLGECAEYCGTQHAKMQFVVIAQERDEFEEWVAAQQQPAPEPDTPQELEGLQVFLGSSCVYCHTIRGTNALSDFGPDLTHLASRRTLGAGAVPNTRGHLAGWIVDSQSIKPGNMMPPMDLDSDALQALLAYLETLQ